MNNNSVLQAINDCKNELDKIKQFIGASGQQHEMVPFLTKYMIIKCCGTIENAFKTIISDYHLSIPIQARNYIKSTFTDSSMNPSKVNICRVLEKFDEDWNRNFKTKLSVQQNKGQLEASLKSLNSNRNQFAHGGSPTVSHTDVIQHFEHAVKIIELLDETVNGVISTTDDHDDIDDNN